jgi:hypothetical protein
VVYTQIIRNVYPNLFQVNTIVVSIRDVVVEFAVLRMFLAMSLFFSMFPEDLVFSKIGFDGLWLSCS